MTISLPSGSERTTVAGVGERNLKIIREALGVAVAARKGTVQIRGDSRAVGQASHVMKRLATAARQKRPMTRQELLDTIATVGTLSGSSDSQVNHDPTTLDVYLRGRQIRPHSEGQRAYLESIQEHDLTFCTGPAGTGKTYLAVAAAVQMLKRGQARKLILVRPAVEAGERLGFLPGDMQDKVNPYLRPLLDALRDMMEYDQIQHFMESDLIEIAPLAFMRGRTLNAAVIILDEAQNTTRLQMLMFLTRLGHGAKMIVTGDTSQIDLAEPRQSGLIDSIHRLRRVDGIAFVTLQRQDIVRHHLVQRVVKAYGDHDTTRDANGDTRQADPRPDNGRGVDASELES